MTKYNRRVEWVKNHLNDMFEQFSLDCKIDWRIMGVFIVEEPIISNKLYNRNMEMVSQMELTVERIR